MCLADLQNLNWIGSLWIFTMVIIYLVKDFTSKFSPERYWINEFCLWLAKSSWDGPNLKFFYRQKLDKSWFRMCPTCTWSALTVGKLPKRSFPLTSVFLHPGTYPHPLRLRDQCFRPRSFHSAAPQDYTDSRHKS